MVTPPSGGDEIMPAVSPSETTATASQQGAHAGSSGSSAVLDAASPLEPSSRRRRHKARRGETNPEASGGQHLAIGTVHGAQRAAADEGEKEQSSSGSASGRQQTPKREQGQGGKAHQERTFPSFPGDLPWSQRSWLYELKPFRGIYYDLRRRAPYYLSDWTATLAPHNCWTVAQAVVRIYFINLMPAIAYVLDMYHRTNGAYGVNEVILASALAAIVFPIFSVQPLTFVGVTGLINLVNYTQYDIVVEYYGLDQMDYLRVQAWALIWAAGFHFLAAIFNLSDFTRFITDMTSSTFGFYVGIVYIQKGIELLLLEFEPAPLDNATGWLSVTIAMLFVVSVYLVSAIGKTSYLPFHLRSSVGAFAFAAGCIFWTGFSHFPRNSLDLVPIEQLPITRAFFPTMDRSWFIDFWNIEARWAFVGAPLGFLITLLFWFDHNVSSVMAQARQFPVRRPAGFHWDFFLLGITTLVSGFLGLPAPNGLVPQCPWHTEALSVFQQVRDPAKDEESRQSAHASGHAGKVRKQPTVPAPEHIVNTRVVEQRGSHLLIGALTLATMTRPFLVALGTMPRAVFAGIFLLVGWGSIQDNIITSRTLAVFRDRALAPADDPLNEVRRAKIALFVGIQWFFFAITFAISQTIAGIGFPVLITLLIPFRYWVVPKWFSPLELRILDAPTADADGVLASIGHESERCTGIGCKIAADTKIAGTEYNIDENRSNDSSDNEEDDVEPYVVDGVDFIPQKTHARFSAASGVRTPPFATSHTPTTFNINEPGIAHMSVAEPPTTKAARHGGRRSLFDMMIGRSHEAPAVNASSSPSSSTAKTDGAHAAGVPAMPASTSSAAVPATLPPSSSTTGHEARDEVPQSPLGEAKPLEVAPASHNATSSGTPPRVHDSASHPPVTSSNGATTQSFALASAKATDTSTSGVNGQAKQPASSTSKTTSKPGEGAVPTGIFGLTPKKDPTEVEKRLAARAAAYLSMTDAEKRRKNLEAEKSKAKNRAEKKQIKANIKAEKKLAADSKKQYKVEDKLVLKAQQEAASKAREAKNAPKHIAPEQQRQSHNAKDSSKAVPVAGAVAATTGVAAHHKHDSSAKETEEEKQERILREVAATDRRLAADGAAVRAADAKEQQGYRQSKDIERQSKPHAHSAIQDRQAESGRGMPEQGHTVEKPSGTDQQFNSEVQGQSVVTGDHATLPHSGSDHGYAVPVAAGAAAATGAYAYGQRSDTAGVSEQQKLDRQDPSQQVDKGSSNDGTSAVAKSASGTLAGSDAAKARRAAEARGVTGSPRRESSIDKSEKASRKSFSRRRKSAASDRQSIIEGLTVASPFAAALYLQSEAQDREREDPEEGGASLTRKFSRPEPGSRSPSRSPGLAAPKTQPLAAVPVGSDAEKPIEVAPTTGADAAQESATRESGAPVLAAAALPLAGHNSMYDEQAQQALLQRDAAQQARLLEEEKAAAALASRRDEEARAAQAARERSDAEAVILKSRQDGDAALQKMQREKAEQEELAAKARQERDAAEIEIARAKQESDAALERADQEKTAAQAAAAAALAAAAATKKKADEEAEQARQLAQTEAEQARQQAQAEADQARQQAEAENAKAKQESDAALKKAAEEKRAAEAAAAAALAAAAAAKKEADDEAERVRQLAQTEAEQARQQAQAEAEQARQQAQADADQARQQAEAENAKAKQESDAALEKAEQEKKAAEVAAAAALAALAKAKHDESERARQAQAEADAALAAAEASRQEQEELAAKARAEREEAEAAVAAALASAEKARQDRKSAEDALAAARKEVEEQRAQAQKEREAADLARKEAEEQRKKISQEKADAEKLRLEEEAETDKSRKQKEAALAAAAAAAAALATAEAARKEEEKKTKKQQEERAEAEARAVEDEKAYEAERARRQAETERAQKEADAETERARRLADEKKARREAQVSTSTQLSDSEKEDHDDELAGLAAAAAAVVAGGGAAAAGKGKGREVDPEAQQSKFTEAATEDETSTTGAAAVHAVTSSNTEATDAKSGGEAKEGGLFKRLFHSRGTSKKDEKRKESGVAAPALSANYHTVSNDSPALAAPASEEAEPEPVAPAKESIEEPIAPAAVDEESTSAPVETSQETSEEPTLARSAAPPLSQQSIAVAPADQKASATEPAATSTGSAPPTLSRSPSSSTGKGKSAATSKSTSGGGFFSSLGAPSLGLRGPAMPKKSKKSKTSAQETNTATQQPTPTSKKDQIISQPKPSVEAATPSAAKDKDAPLVPGTSISAIAPSFAPAKGLTVTSIATSAPKSAKAGKTSMDASAPTSKTAPAASPAPPKEEPKLVKEGDKLFVEHINPRFATPKAQSSNKASAVQWRG